MRDNGLQIGEVGVHCNENFTWIPFQQLRKMLHRLFALIALIHQIGQQLEIKGEFNDKLDYQGNFLQIYPIPCGDPHFRQSERE